MKFPFFASFIVLIIWLKYEIGKADRLKAKASDSFWDKEMQANNVRKKSLDNLHYVEIPYDLIPRDLLTEYEAMRDSLAMIDALSGKKIVNLNGITNTDLKLSYGTANITPLSEYDENYTKLITALYTIASLLYENGYAGQAVPLLEFGVMTGTDMSGYYRLLQKHYRSTKEPGKLDWLKSCAEKVEGMMKDSICRIVNEPEN
ncbi:MAG: hypothetical protein E7294_06595 [Lachnospiraceae bacterium]|jgi:hypothetical protein|nr:hypothetical protein [Lachnospiraceae bacterium]